MYRILIVYIIGQSLLYAGGAAAPQILSVSISERDVCGGNGCALTVEWSEPFISCTGSVSQYVLFVTPPTCDCDTSPDCIVMDSTAVYTLFGSNTQYVITVNETKSLEYGVTLRADTCGNRLNGELSPPHVPGRLYTVATDSPPPILSITGSVTSCEAIYQYSPYDGSLESVVVSWTPEQVCIIAHRWKLLTTSHSHQDHP